VSREDHEIRAAQDNGVNRSEAPHNHLLKLAPSDSVGTPIIGDSPIEELAARLQP
jgi:hypothetical protein